MTKKNFYILSLIVMCLTITIIVPTYAKFSSNYITEDDVVGLALDLSVDITGVEEYEQITVDAGERIKFNVNITNNMGALAYYGVWYRMVEPTDLSSDIFIGTLAGTSVSTSGLIDDDDSKVVTIAIINNSSNQITVDIGVANSFTSTSDIEYLGGKYLIVGDVDLKTYLNEKLSGSYVLYAGNNGCNNTNAVNGYTSCSGKNANYVSDTNMGYCGSNYKFNANGWRVAYVINGNAYLVSAGAPECMAVSDNYYYIESEESSLSIPRGMYYWSSEYIFNNETGFFELSGDTRQEYFPNSAINAEEMYTCLSSTLDGTCSKLYYLSYVDIENSTYVGYGKVYRSSLISPDDVSLKYCNALYAKGGVCNSSTVWGIKDSDYEAITGKSNSFGALSCNSGSAGAYEDVDCGYFKSLINNGGFYWFNNNFSYYWDANEIAVSNITPSISMGVRPVIVLDSSVIVVSGSGTYDDPYVIDIG